MSRKQLEKALRRADYRDKKRRTKMRVTGKGVFALNRQIRKP